MKLKQKNLILASLGGFVLGLLCLFVTLKAQPNLAASLLGLKAPSSGAVPTVWNQPGASGLVAKNEADPEAEAESEQEPPDPMLALRKQFFGQDPFEDLAQMHGSFQAGGQEVTQREDDSSIYFEIKGVDQTKLRTKVDGGYLTIEGESKKELGKGGAFHGTMQSSFHRSFPLPRNVIEDKMELSSEQDKVVLRFPKRS